MKHTMVERSLMEVAGARSAAQARKYAEEQTGRNAVACVRVEPLLYLVTLED